MNKQITYLKHFYPIIGNVWFGWKLELLCIVLSLLGTVLIFGIYCYILK